MEAVVLEDSAGEEVGGGNHPHISRIERIGENLENARQILAGSPSDAYSLRGYGMERLVDLGEPIGDLVSQWLVPFIRAVEKARREDFGIRQGRGGGFFDLG